MNIFRKLFEKTVQANPFLWPIAGADELAQKRATQRQDTRKKLGVTNDTLNFWKGLDSLDEKAQNEYKTANPLDNYKKQHPNYTIDDLNNVWNNGYKRDILKRMNHPKAKELYNRWFDQDGQLTEEGVANWKYVDDYVAKLAMENDVDGMSDEKQARVEEDWYKRWEKTFADKAYDDQSTTVREAAKEYLDKTVDTDSNRQTKDIYYKELSKEGIGFDGKTRQDHIKDADNLFSSVCQDYELMLNREEYKDLQNYDRLKDTDALKLTDEEKLNLYAEFYMNYNRGGEKYAIKKVQEFFQNKMANAQTDAEKAMNWYAAFQDDAMSMLIGATGLVYGLADTLTGGNITKALNLGTEEDKKRREDQRWWQNIFDNPLVQYSNDLMETHVYDPAAQRRMKELGLQDNQFYETAEQEQQLMSWADALNVTSNYGFTAATTIMSGGSSALVKGLVGGSLKLMKGMKFAGNAAKWNSTLRKAVKARDAINVINGGIIATAEGAGITLQNKVDHYHEGVIGLQNKHFEQWVEQNPQLAAAKLQQMGLPAPQGTLQLNLEGGGKVQFSPEEKRQMIEQFEAIENGDFSNLTNPSADPEALQQYTQRVMAETDAFKKAMIQRYEQDPNNIGDVTDDYERLQDMVEDAATAEFFLQSSINGFIHHGLKNTLYSKSVQQARKNVARRLGFKNTSNQSQLNKRVSIEQGSNGRWTARGVRKTRWDLAKERFRESAGEAWEEGIQDVAGAFGTGYYDYAYQHYIDSRFGNENGVNSAVDYSIWNALGNGLLEAGASTIDGETLTDAFYGFLSSAIGGPNLNTNFSFKNWKKGGLKEIIDANANGERGLLSNISNLSPISIRGAWTPLLNPTEVNLENSRNEQLANHLNAFFSNDEIQNKILTAGGLGNLIKQYNDAIENDEEFEARNAKFGQVFSIVNMLDKLKGTAYHDAVTISLDKRANLDLMSDEQIKRELEDSESDASKALREFKSDISNHTGDAETDTDFSTSDENVKNIRRIAKNASEMKLVLDEVNEKREQIQRDFGADLDDDAMDAALYQQLSIADKEKRIAQIDAQLNEISSFNKDAQANNTSKQIIAKYGSLENLRDEKENLEKQRKSIQTQMEVNEENINKIREKEKQYQEALKASKGKETEDTKKYALTQNEKKTLGDYRFAEAYVKYLDDQISTIDKQDQTLSKVIESKIKEKQKDQTEEGEGSKKSEETPVLTEQEIMELDAASRAYMLNEKNKTKYSQKQQEVIDAINRRGRTQYGKDWDKMVEDVSRLEHQVAKDQDEQNRILYDSKILQDYVNKARVARLKRERVKQYEPLFVEANNAVRQEDSKDSDSVARRRDALTKLSQFLNTPAPDYITAEVKKDLAKKYAKSHAMQALDTQEAELEQYADDMDNVNIVMEEIQQYDDSSVDSSENQPSKKVTRERELKDEDNYLMACALQYAFENGIPLDELPDAVTTDAFKEYTTKWNEVQKKKGIPAKVENLDSEDARRLMAATIKLHHQLVEDRKADEREKQERKAKTKAAKSPAPEIVKPGQKAEEKKDDKKDDSKEEPEREPSEAYEIGVANLMNAVDDEVERLVGDETQWNPIKQAFKETIERLSKKYDNTKSLQAALYRKYNTNRLMGSIAHALNKPVNTRTRDAAPNELETTNLANYPEGSVMATYIANKRIKQNYNKVAKTLHDAGVNGEAIDVMFLYDPRLAKDLEEKLGDSYRSDEMPIVLVVPLTEKNRKRLGISAEDEVGAISLGKNDFEGKGIKYLPIGFMPSSTDKKVVSSARTKAIRKQVDTGLAKGGEEQPRILRYRNGNTYQDGTPKENGGRITAHITTMNPDSTDPVRSNKNTPLRELSELGIENVSNPEESIITDPISERDRKAYEVARGDRKKLRATRLYKDIRKAILGMLRPKQVEYVTSEGETKTRWALKYGVVKGNRAIEGTEGEILGEIMIKSIEETTHRDNPEVKLVDLLRQFREDNDNSDEIIGNGNGDNGANSRLTGLYHALSHLFDKKDNKDKNLEANAGWPLDVSQFDADGRLDPDAKDDYNKSMKEFADQIKKKLDSYINIAGDTEVEVKIDKINPVDQKTLTVTIRNSGKELATITLNKGETFSKKHMVSLFKQCVLDETKELGKDIRTSGKFDKVTGEPYGLVKWQVNFQDAESKEKIDQNTYNDTYDDGILTLRMNKLGYRPATVKMDITPAMRTGLYGGPSSGGSRSSGSPTGSGPKHQTRAGNGADVDSNSGMVTKNASADITSDEVDPRVKKIIEPLRQMLADSKSRRLSDDEKTYEIRGQKHVRVTSIKRFFSKSKSEKFDETSPWGLPSTAMGNSLDEFGRDVLNNLFDELDAAERKEVFAGYPNSTAANYEAVYQKLKKIQANLAAQGQTILKIGDVNNPGSIVAAGAIPVKMTDRTTKILGVGGTLDILAVDSDGNLHIYDFKTYHSNAELNEEISDKKDYDIQLSLYAKFLEQEYGLKVASINIIPVHTPYSTPRGVGGSVEYTRETPGSEQLLANGKRFTGAAFEMGDPFPLTRLTDEELTLAFDRLMSEMTDEEKELLADALTDQYDQPIMPQDIGQPAAPEGNQGPEKAEPADPVMMSDEDIASELSSLEGKTDDESNARRSELQYQQDRRQETYTEVQSKYVPGVKVHSDRNGEGTVTGYNNSMGVLTMLIQFADGVHSYNVLANVESSLEIVEVPEESLSKPVEEQNKPEQKPERKAPTKKGSNYRVEEADSVRRKPKRQLKKRTPAPKSDGQMVDDLAKRREANTPLEEQEDQCKKK